MANTTDLVFKKIVNREYTSATKKWYEEKGAVPFKLKGSDVWIEPIPEEAGEIVNRIKLYTHLSLTKDTSVADNKSWLVCHSSSQLDARISAMEALLIFS